MASFLGHLHSVPVCISSAAVPRSCPISNTLHHHCDTDFDNVTKSQALFAGNLTLLGMARSKWRSPTLAQASRSPCKTSAVKTQLHGPLCADLREHSCCYWAGIVPSGILSLGSLFSKALAFFFLQVDTSEERVESCFESFPILSVWGARFPFKNQLFPYLPSYSLELTHVPFLTQASIFHLSASPVALSVDQDESTEQG